MRKQIQTAMLGAPEFEVKPQPNYRPRISPEHLSLLWVLKQKTQKPIAKLVAEAIEAYLQNPKWKLKRGGEDNAADD